MRSNRAIYKYTIIRIAKQGVLRYNRRMKTEFFTLKNGLRVLFIDTNTFPTITTLLLVGAGSRYEDEKTNGVSHFLEHMFYKGSKKYPNPEIISQIIEGMGGYWNAFTSKDYTGYYIKASTDHFEKMIDMISDLLLNSLFDPAEIEKEKGVIVEEINMYEDTPQRRISDIFDNVMFRRNPLGYDIAGSKNTVTSFDRNTFLSYKSQRYYPNNTVLVVAGGLKITRSTQSSIEDYLKIIQEKFSGWETEQVKGFDPVIKIDTEPQIYVKSKKTEQAHFCYGYPTFSIADSRRPVLKVLATILGGGASSRLFQEVREKRGLCYYIGTGIDQYEDIGTIVTQSGVAKDVEKVKDAVRATHKEHVRIAKGSVSESDIARSKEMLKGRLLLSLEDSFNIAHQYGLKQLHENSIESPEERIKQIEKVTKQEIVNLAKELFTEEKLTFAIIGPFQQTDFSSHSLF